MGDDDVWSGLHSPREKESQAESFKSPLADFFPSLSGISSDSQVGSSMVSLAQLLERRTIMPSDCIGDLEGLRFSTVTPGPSVPCTELDTRSPQNSHPLPSNPGGIHLPDQPNRGSPPSPSEPSASESEGSCSDSSDLGPDPPPTFRLQSRFSNCEEYRDWFKRLLQYEMKPTKDKLDQQLHQAVILMVLRVDSIADFQKGDKLYLIDDKSFLGTVYDIQRCEQKRKKEKNEMKNLFVDRRGLEKLAVHWKPINIYQSRDEDAKSETARIEIPEYRSEIVLEVASVTDFSCGDVLKLHSYREDHDPFNGTICDIDEDRNLISVNCKKLGKSVDFVTFKSSYINQKMRIGLLKFNRTHPFAPIILGIRQDAHSTEKYSPYHHKDLNHRQNKSVMQALLHDFTLIQGPPGTGKTRVASVLACEFVMEEKRKKLPPHQQGKVLVCASSNIATDSLVISISKLSSEAKVVRLYSHVKEQTINPATTLLAFHYLLRARLVSHFPHLAPALKSLENPSRKKMIDLFVRDENHIPVDAFIERLSSERFDTEAKRFIETFDIVYCTCVSSDSRLLDRVNFKYVILDEAAFSPEPETLLALKNTCRKVVLIGDQMQLPPVVISDQAKQCGYGRSLFERLLACGMKSTLLNLQYRMLPELSEFPRRTFYAGKLKDDESVLDAQIPAEIRQYFRISPLVLINCQGTEYQPSNSYSYYNKMEVTAVFAVLDDLYQLGIPGQSIGVITAYDAQRKKIVKKMKKLKDNHWGKDNNWGKEVEVKNVDGYQGREKDVIVISTVRSNKAGKIGFLSDKRRINVALTRAKFGLILIGNQQVLMHNDTWGRFIEYGRAIGDQRDM